MSIVRTKKRKEKGFTVIDNSILQNQELTYEARGLLCYLLSKPDDWQCRTKDLQKAAKAGRDKVLRILKELERFGHARFETVRNDKGHLSGKTWTIHEQPFSRTPENPSIGDRTPENPKIGKPENRKTPTSGKHGPILKKELLQNKESIKNKESERTARTVPKKAKKNPSTLNDHSSSSSGEGSAAAGGGADSPDPAVAIKEKVLSSQQQIETWKMRYKVNGDLPELAENFADWLIAKSCEGMGDKEIESWADRTGSIVFRKAFETSWLKNLKKFKTTETPSSKVLPKSKSQYV